MLFYINKYHFKVFMKHLTHPRIYFRKLLEDYLSLQVCTYKAF